MDVWEESKQGGKERRRRGEGREGEEAGREGDRNGWVYTGEDKGGERKATKQSMDGCMRWRRSAGPPGSRQRSRGVGVGGDEARDARGRVQRRCGVVITLMVARVWGSERHSCRISRNLTVSDRFACLKRLNALRSKPAVANVLRHQSRAIF